MIVAKTLKLTLLVLVLQIEGLESWLDMTFPNISIKPFFPNLDLSTNNMNDDFGYMYEFHLGSDSNELELPFSSEAVSLSSKSISICLRFTMLTPKNTRIIGDVAGVSIHIKNPKNGVGYIKVGNGADKRSYLIYLGSSKVVWRRQLDLCVSLENNNALIEGRSTTVKVVVNGKLQGNW